VSVNTHSDNSQEKFEYFSRVRKDYAEKVQVHLEELTTYVSNTSKTGWFLQLEWKKVKEKELIGLIVALECLEVVGLDSLSPTARYFFEELAIQLHRTKKRMQNAKHLHFSFNPDMLDSLRELGEADYLPSVREYKGNYELDILECLRRLFRVRFHKTLRPKRTQRVRGYRDKGSESSPSERARRAANTSQMNEYLIQVLEYCQMTGCSPRQALRLFNMEPEGG